MLASALTLNDGLDGLRWGLAAISLIAAIAYQLIESRQTSAIRTALKTLSIAALVPLPLLSLSAGPAVALIALALALAFGSAGDYFLALKGDAKNFKRGVAAFLVGHIFYLIVMVPRLGSPSLTQIILMIVLATFAIGTCLLIAPKLGEYKKPIWAYMGVISLMALAALAMPTLATGIGAMLFVFSDAVIVVNQFARPVPYRGPIVWITYYAGQVMIAASLLALLA